jgi:Glycosyl transferase family 2
MTWLSVVVPTAGDRREGLLRTIESVRRQAAQDVQTVVVADTHALLSRAPLESLRNDVEAAGASWFEHDGGLHCYGQPQRTFGARHAAGEWVAFSQDDNILAQGAIAAIRRAVLQQPCPRPLFFRIHTYWGVEVWHQPSLYQGNIDADCLVLPRDIAAEVEWGLRYEGDFDAALAAMHIANGDVAWRTETIALARPESVWW